MRNEDVHDVKKKSKTSVDADLQAEWRGVLPLLSRLSSSSWKTDLPRIAFKLLTELYFAAICKTV